MLCQMQMAIKLFPRGLHSHRKASLSVMQPVTKISKIRCVLLLRLCHVTQNFSCARRRLFVWDSWYVFHVQVARCMVIVGFM